MWVRVGRNGLIRLVTDWWLVTIILYGIKLCCRAEVSRSVDLSFLVSGSWGKGVVVGELVYCGVG